jgi:hypothetical protein
MIRDYSNVSSQSHLENVSSREICSNISEFSSVGDEGSSHSSMEDEIYAVDHGLDMPEKV